MSPIKNEFLTRMALGHKIITIGDFSLNLETRSIKGKIPEEIKGHVKNITNRWKRFKHT